MLSSSQIARNHNAFSSGLGLNQAAYQDTMFGGITPFGQNFGDTIGHSAASMASTGFNAAMGVGMAASMTNAVGGFLGLGSSSTLGSLSKYLGGNLSLAAHLGPMMAIGAGLGQMNQGSMQRQRVQNAMNENFGARLNMGGRMGTGVNREQVRRFTNELRQLSDIPELFTSMGELTSILDKVTDMKILQGARDSRDFKTRFKKMVGSLRDMSRNLGSTMEEALPFLQSSVSQGFLDPKMQALNIKTLAASTSVGIGMGRGTLNQMQEQGAASLRQQGGDSRLGAAGIRSIANQLSIAQQQGIISQEEITRATGKVGEEGVRAFAEQVFSAQTSFMQNQGAGRFLTAGLAERDDKGDFTGRLDTNKLEQFRAGTLTADDLLEIGRESVNADNAISFENAMARGMGAEAGSQIGSGGLASAIGAILDDMGVTGEQARRRMTAQLTGLRQDMADSLLKVARESQLLQRQEISQLQEGVMHRLRAANYRENMSISGTLSKLGVSLRGAIMSPFQRAGTNVSDAFAKAGDDAALRIGRQSGVGKITTTVREMMKMPFTGLGRALGITDPTASDAVFNANFGKDYTTQLAFDDDFSLFGDDKRRGGILGSASQPRRSEYFDRRGERISTEDVDNYIRGDSSSIIDSSGQREFVVYDEQGKPIAFNELEVDTMLRDQDRTDEYGLLDDENARFGRDMRGDNSTGIGDVALQATLPAAGIALRSTQMGMSILNAGKFNVASGGAMMKGVAATTRNLGIKAGSRLAARGMGRLAGGLALRALGIGARIVSGPVGWALLAADVGQMAYDAYQEKKAADKVETWARSVGMDPEEAKRAFEKGDKADLELIRKKNAEFASDLIEGKFAPRGVKETSKIARDAYQYLLTSGKGKDIIDRGGSTTEILGNIQEELTDSDGGIFTSSRFEDMTGDQMKEVAGLLASGKDLQGKETEVTKALSMSFKERISDIDATQYTIRGAEDLAKAQEEIEGFFDSDYFEYIDDDEIVSETFREGFQTGTLSEQKALLHIVDSKAIRTSILSTDNSQNELLRRQHPKLRDLSDEQLNGIRQDLKNAVGENGIDQLDTTMETIRDRLEGLVTFKAKQEAKLKSADVRKAGDVISAEFGDTAAGRELGDALANQGEAGIRRSGQLALDLLEEIEPKQLEEMKDGGAKKFLQNARAVRDQLKDVAEQGESALIDFLKKKMPGQEEEIEKLFDNDGKVSSAELQDITSRVITGSTGSILMANQGMNESELIAAGGQTEITKQYLDSAKEAAQAQTAFVRAVYMESPKREAISARAKELGRKGS